MRRTTYGRGLEIDPFSKFLGRIETEIEIYARHVLGCTEEELTARLGAALVGLAAQPQFDVAEVPDLRSAAAPVDKRLRKVTLGGSAPGGGAWRNKDGSLMTKAQRKAEARRRMGKCVLSRE